MGLFKQKCLEIRMVTVHSMFGCGTQLQQGAVCSAFYGPALSLTVSAELAADVRWQAPWFAMRCSGAGVMRYFPQLSFNVTARLNTGLSGA
jgi:hypothetical protein